jgi:hypothetical protein
MLVSNSMWAEKSFTSSSTKPPCSQYSKAATVELEDSLRLVVREPLKTSMLPYNEQFLQTSVKCGLCSRVSNELEARDSTHTRMVHEIPVLCLEVRSFD